MAPSETSRINIRKKSEVSRTGLGKRLLAFLGRGCLHIAESPPVGRTPSSLWSVFFLLHSPLGRGCPLHLLSWSFSVAFMVGLRC